MPVPGPSAAGPSREPVPAVPVVPPLPDVLPPVPADSCARRGRRHEHAVHDLREIAVVEDGLQVGAVVAVIITASAEARRCEHE